jgi:DGQHR domain-containing protein
MPSDVLAECCTVDTRFDNPIEGFQRKLDPRRADEIARYIDEGIGTIPSSIVLSAQTDAQLAYTRARRSITFKRTPKSFLIIDGQHRVFGFAKAKSTLRVPVVIYNSLTRAEECKLFIDINTTQRPVPNELLLDIKRLADSETSEESVLTDVFDFFTKESDSPLLGLMSPAQKAKGKLSRVTFKAAMGSVLPAFDTADAKVVYRVVSAYLGVWMEHLKRQKGEGWITNPILFRAVLSIFQDVAQRVTDRFGKDYSVQHFRDVLDPFFAKVRTSTLKTPGSSYVTLADTFKKMLRQQLTIAV